MKGISGNQTKGIQTGTNLDVVDNTGAKVIQVIAVPGYKGVSRRQPNAGVGDIIIGSVKKGTPQMRRQIVHAVVVRQKRPMRRPDGTMVSFEDNAAVITTETGETKGTDIKGPVAKEAAERWPRVSATANTIL
ncbi:MAG: 50S ribosomal protein L14 [Candidatus Methanomethylophilaceae archaeon]|jgi:large subunit ribosomal protein L14|nr:50S ribosomal protein L14 [Candidatus Methanomethylophilaceae archaeon]